MSHILKLMVVSVAALVAVSLFFLYGINAEQKGSHAVEMKKLTPEEERVIVHKGTEAPFTGKYVNNHEEGVYHCKRCGAPLFRSKDKFDSECGWPSFDEAIPGAVREIPDPDGVRTEIVCAVCGAHLGHVFKGEKFTEKNVRHCVNSVSMDFEAARLKSEDAYFAGGCFWGVEYFLEKVPGVLLAESGYMGGHQDSPSYEQVCTSETGHAETVHVVFDPSKTSFEKLARLFFEIHDPTQMDRQGPDIGNQYRSAVFYKSEDQRRVAERLIGLLKQRGFKAVTQLVPAGHFWKAEEYHQEYYMKTGKTPYCHSPVNRFGDK